MENPLYICELWPLNNETAYADGVIDGMDSWK